MFIYCVCEYRKFSGAAGLGTNNHTRTTPTSASPHPLDSPLNSITRYAVDLGLTVFAGGSSMAGTGPAPKDPDRRVRTSRTTKEKVTGTTVLHFQPGDQPYLRADIDWHPETVQWWKVWAEAAQSDLFTATDWRFLHDTALIHTKFWNGDMGVAAELRLRVAKFGATPEDRARLRMVFADADEKDERRGTRGSSGQPGPATPYGGLRAVPKPS